MELRDAIRQGRMTRFQWMVVATCILLTVIDGYEILIAGFTLPALSRVWELSVGQQGLVASIGTLGMGLGAAVLGPIADRVGRRKHILFSLVFIVIGMVLTGLSPNFGMFLVFRFFAGLFLGGIVPSVNVLAAEYANDKRRGTVMGIYGIGFPLGAAIGGFLSVWLIGQWGWQGPYIFSAIVTAAAAIWCYFALPESVSYLVERRPPGAAQQYSRISQRLGLGRDETLPEPTSITTKPSLSKDMWQGVMLKRTVLLWTAFGLLGLSFYFANTWTANLVAQSTGNERIGIVALALVSVGGVIGALLFAALTVRFHPRLVASAILIWGLVIYFLFGQAFSNPGMVFVLAVGVGTAANGAVAAFYAISPSIYPTVIRASAVGLLMAFGRVVAFLAPNIAAALLAAGITPPRLFQIHGVFMLLAGIFVYLLHRSYRGGDSLDAMQIESQVAAQLDRAVDR